MGIITDHRQQTGKIGEDAVCSYLEARGHKILSRNRHQGHLELDIISLDTEGVHFVEVKTRRPPYQALPQDSVTFPKQRRLVNAAQSYLSKYNGLLPPDCECHFDIAAVILDGSRTEITYFKDAFIPIFK